MPNIATRICKICGKKFVPNSCRQYYCKDMHYRICPICGKQYPESNLDKFKYPPTTCSMKCRVKKREQTSIEKYGIKTPGNNPIAREKSKKTMQERYGVDYAQESKEINQKSKNTWMKKYGVDNPQKVEQIKDKTKETNIAKYGSTTYLTSDIGKVQINQIMQDKYGTAVPLRNAEIKRRWVATNLRKYGTASPSSNEMVKQKSKATSIKHFGTDHPMKSDIVKQRVKDTFIRNYGVDNCFKSPEIIAKIHDSFYKHYGVHSVMEAKEISNKIRETNMQKYGVPYYVMLSNISKSSGRISKINTEFIQKLNNIGIYSTSEFTIKNKSYDVAIPQGNTLIEINPSYTHSTVGNHWNTRGISKYYHIEKTLLAAKYGHRCIHIWDWDNVSKFINLMTTKTVIYRKLKPEIISIKESKQFIDKYSLYDITENVDHILFIGIRYRTKLMALMGFNLTDPITNTWTILCIEQRFHYTVHNGNRTILEHFISLYQPNKIMAYADYSKTNGEMLENLGFTYSRFIMPNKIWSKGHHAIVDDPSILDEAMLKDNWLPVYNCGYKVYELNLDGI